MSGPEAVVAFAVVGFVGASGLTLVRAIAQRIAGRAPGVEVAGELQALRDEVDMLRREVADGQARSAGELDELHNRVDFAERMLAQVKDSRAALPGGN